MLTFVETPVFSRQIGEILRDDEYRRLQEFVVAQPLAGDLIPETGGARKLRWSIARALRALIREI